MNQKNNDTLKACSQVLARLALAHQVVDKLLFVYGEATAAPQYLQGCLEGARVVREELESVADVVPEFARWYAPYEEEFAGDPLFRWAFGARDKNLHQRDLAEHSRARVDLIASYRRAPLASWEPGSVFSSGQDIVNSIPETHLTSHVRENGVVRISRRWVDNELPDWEVLGALDTVYDRLMGMIADLYRHCGTDFPATEPTADVLGPDEDRRVYLGVKDGLYLAHSERRPRSPAALAAAAEENLGRSSILSSLNATGSFREAARVYFVYSGALLRAGRFHPGIVFFSGTKTLTARDLAFEHRAHKYAVLHEQAEFARQIGADGVIMLVEAWHSGAAALPPGQVPDKKTAAGEALLLHGADASGTVINLGSAIRRGTFRRSKVKALGPPFEDANSLPATMVPFLEMWGALNSLALPDNADYSRDVVFRD